MNEAIGDLPSLGMSIGERCQTYGGSESDFQREARKGLSSKYRGIVWDHITRPVRGDDREAFSLMTPNTKYGALPKRLRRYRSDIFSDKYKRLDRDGLSRTITAHLAKDGYWYIHPTEDRTLSVREAARIQTFPDRFRFEGTRSHAFRQIGNAAPPALMAAVGKALVSALDSRDEHSPSKAHPALERRQGLHRRLLEWHARRSSPWTQQGEPWPVLVSILCGRYGTRDKLAKAVLAQWPDPAAIIQCERNSDQGQSWERYPHPRDRPTCRGLEREQFSRTAGPLWMWLRLPRSVRHKQTGWLRWG